MTSEAEARVRNPAAGAYPGILDSPSPAPISVPSRGPESGSVPADTNPDAPVRIEVEMPRDLYDRLTNWEHAPRSRYDMATGRAEYVAEPSMAHEGRAARISRLFGYLEDALDDAGHPALFIIGRATRLLSDDGAFEPDECLFMDKANAHAAARLEDYLDTRKDHPVPELVVEIDRSVDSSHKLVPYFRMGVREAWTWSPGDGARLWGADPDAQQGFSAAGESRMFPGLSQEDLDRLLSGYASIELSRETRRLARRVADALLKG